MRQSSLCLPSLPATPLRHKGVTAYHLILLVALAFGAAFTLALYIYFLATGQAWGGFGWKRTLATPGDSIPLARLRES